MLVFMTGCPEPAAPPVEPVPDLPATERDAFTFATVEEVLAANPEADAAALVEPVGDGEVRGYVLFEEIAGDLQVEVNLTGLEPGLRGFHVHEHGSCEPGDDGTPGGAAGGHFAPLGRPHGSPHDAPEERHAGDFGNLPVADDGTVRVTFADPVAALAGETGVVGRAVIVHAGEDDLASQPSGDAGARVGCGVIAAR